MDKAKFAKKSAIVLLGVLLVLLAVSFLPFGNDGSGSEKAAVKEKAILLQQIQEFNNLPPAVDEKIEPAVKDDIKEALYSAAAAKSPEEAAEKMEVEVLVKASSADAGKGIKKAGGEILNVVDSVDKTAKYFAVKADADKVVELASGDDVMAVSTRGEVYPTLDSSVPVIKADSFWNAGYRGSGVKVAVLDTGIDKSHPMLQGKVAAERDFTSSGSAADDCGHGTHVAGIVAGSKANGGTYDGVAPGAQLINAKVLNIDSNGKCGGYVDYIIAAIGWALDPDGNSATDDGAKVISMSLGGKGETSASLESELKAAVAKGAVIVVSSGNCGSGCPDVLSCGSFRGVTWPGNSPSVITVGAVDDSKNIACFSSGENVQNVGIKPDFAAPGVDVTSSVPGNGYESMKGTSMAAPHVSGAVALMLGKSQQLKQDDARRILEKTALDLGDAGKDTSYGFGLIDLAKALIYKEGLVFDIKLENPVISGNTQKIEIVVYDDVKVNSVKATITKPDGTKTGEFSFIAKGNNAFDYDYSDTAKLGSYVVEGAINYGGSAGGSNIDAGSSAETPSVTAYFTASFKVTSLTGDFGNVEAINVSEKQLLSGNLTANITFANTATSELSVSMLLQLLDNLTVVQEIRLPAATVAANSKATIAVNNGLAVGPGNYTLRILTDYGAGSLVNETNITVADDLAPKISSMSYEKGMATNDLPVFAAKLFEHSLSTTSLASIGRQKICPPGLACLQVYDLPVSVNYTTRIISQVGNEYNVVITIFDELPSGYSYDWQITACDSFGNCAVSGILQFNVNSSCSGNRLLIAKTYEQKSAFEEAAYNSNSLCVTVINKSITGTPPSSYLEKFDAVVWSTGTDLVNIDGSDAAALMDYYGKKGKVAVEGSDVAFRHGNNDFIRSVLHSELKTDLGFTVASVANMSNLSINVTRPHPVVYGLASPLPFNATVDPFPDAVQPYNGSVELAEWSGLDTGGSAVVAYESEDGKIKTLLLPFSIAALNGSDAKAIATSALKWLLEDSAVDVAPLEIKYGGEYPLITRKIPPGSICIAVCREMWQLKNGNCEFTNCGSGCGADNVTTFVMKDECELAKQYYEGGAGSGVIVEGEEFSATAVVESTETLASPLKVKVLVDGGANGDSEGESALIPATSANYSYNFSTALNAGQHTVTVFANSGFSIKERNYANNVKDFSLVVYPKLPDLRFGAMIYSYDNATGLIAVNLSISNLGGAAAASTVKAYLDGKEAANAAFDLSAGETKQVKLELKSQKGTYDFKIVLDTGNNVQEHNESNNELSQKIYLCSKQKVLVVDDNDAAFFSTPEPSSSDEFLDILRNAGYCVEVWDEKQQGVLGSSDLSAFKAVVWSAGDYFNGTISNDDAMAIGNYSGGVFLEGSDIGLDDSESGLLQSIALATFSSDMLLNESENESLVLKNHTITANISNVSISKEKSPYPDAIDSVGGEVVAEWQSGKAAITATASGGGGRKTAYYAFSVDGITDAAAMEKLVTNTVEWLLEKPNSPPLIQNLSDDVSGEISVAAIKVTMNEGQTKNFSVLAEDPDGDPLTYKWLLNGTQVSDKYYFAFSPKYNESGSYNLTVIVSDGQAEARAELLIIVLDTLDCSAGQKRLCALQLGVCNNSSEICGANWKWPGCTAATYLSHDGKYEAVESSCDGFDNDCNGTADEGFGDMDDDKIADCADDDNDNDGVKDDEDDLIGNESSINFTGDAGDEKKLKIEIEDSEDEKEKAQKVKWFKLNNSDKPLLQFKYNFSKGNIALRNLTIEKQKNNSKEGFTLVKGLDLKGKRKQVFVDRLVNGSNAVCIKDKEVSAVTEVTGSCSGENETLLQCDFPTTGPPYGRSGWACGGSTNEPPKPLDECEPLFCQYIKETAQYQIYGLKHSAIMEQCTDADLDTYLPVGCSGGSDCNDSNSSINPSAVEVCNGVDDNCNGQVDENRVCNKAPVLQGIGNRTAQENAALAFAVAATDSEGDNLTFNATKLPQGAAFNNATASFTWIPDFTQAEVYAVIFNVSDGLLSDYETVNITVADINRPPVFESLTNKTVLENSTMSFTVSVADPDGDAVASLVAYVPPKLGSASLSQSTKEFKWTPTFDDSGTYEVVFSASDSQLSANASVNITVVNVNRAPSFTNLANLTANENVLLQFTAAASDPDGDSVAVNATALPIGAGFDNSTSTLTWTPSFEQAGLYELKFTVTDGLVSVARTINVTVLNTNRVPVISSVNGNLTVNETEVASIAIEATDPDGDAIIYSVNHTGFAQPLPGRFEWSTGFSDSGTYVVLATASDGSLSSSKPVQIAVLNVNRAPKFENLTNHSVLENSTLRFFVNATDPDNDIESVTLAEIPAKFSSAAKFDGKEFSLPVTFEDSGSYSIIFLATDGQLLAFAEVSITVLNVNRAPMITGVSGNLTVNETGEVVIAVSASDPDGDTISYNVNDSRFKSSSASNNVFKWQTGYEDEGTYVVLATVSDGHLSASSAATVKVSNVNRHPAIGSIGNQTVKENSTLKFKISASDPDSDSLTFKVEVPQKLAAADFDTKALEFSWNPGFDDSGTYTAKFTASDGQYTASAEANVTVLNVNRAPAIMLLLVDPPELVMGEGETKTFTADVSDADNDAVTVAWKVNGETVSTAPQLEFMPEYSDSGTYSIELSISDYETTTTTSMSLTVQDTLECGIGQTKLCQLQLGVCANSFETCAAPGKWLGCSAANYGGSYAGLAKTNFIEKFCYDAQKQNANDCKAFCDGLDNDCDGEVDEGRVCNTAPVLAPVANATVKENETLQFTLAATDAENDKLTFASSNLPFLASLDSSTGAFTWTPGFTQAGKYSISFTAADELQNDTKSINVTVANVNRAPEAKIVLDPTGYYVNEGDFKLLRAAAFDPDGDDLEYEWHYLGNYEWQQQGKSKLVSKTNFYYYFPNYTDSDNYNVYKFLLNVSDGNITVNATEYIIVLNTQDCKPKTIEKAQCGSNVGVCKQGEKNRTCGSDYKWAEWGECLGEVKPAPKEDCGTWEDDDCDGVVNNGCTESPDLAPSWMSWKLYDYSSGEIGIFSLVNASLTMRPYLYGEVLNKGKHDAPPSLAVWYLNGRLMVRTELPRINASKSLPVAVLMPYAPYEGDNNLTLVLDANNKIAEKDETNNDVDFPISVKYNETHKPWAKQYGEDYYKRFPTREECENQGKCWR